MMRNQRRGKKVLRKNLSGYVLYEEELGKCTIYDELPDTLSAEEKAKYSRARVIIMKYPTPEEMKAMGENQKLREEKREEKRAQAQVGS